MSGVPSLFVPHRGRAFAVGLFLLASITPAFAAPADTTKAAPAQPSPEAQYQRLVDLQRRAPAPALTTSAGEGGVTAQDITFESKTLKRSMKYRVLLPASYGRSHRHYPVLYMLHGYMNPYYEWDRQTSLTRYLERGKYELIVVLPQFDNSFYVNAASGPGDAYMSYFFRDLTVEVESKFRARTEPPARAVCGVSMGGFGAILWGLKAPRAFSFVAAFSGSIDFMKRADDWATNLAPFDLLKITGPSGSPTRTANDPTALLETVDVSALPPFWIVCGTEDFLFDENVAFVKAAVAKSVPLTFHARPGPHEWTTWDPEVPSMLEALADAMGVERGE